jgi:UV DNA damage endonuclease
MGMGLCCQFLEPKVKRDGSTIYENIIDEKLLQLGAYKDGKYSRERILETYRNNVEEHLRIIPKLVENSIKSFRLTSGLFPLFDFCGDIARTDPTVLDKLSKLGQEFRKHGIRVTCHPGQFCVISSDSDKTVENSIKELEYHAWIFDAMGLDNNPYYAINIHGGKRGRSERLIEVYKSLPENVKNRLTLENDEKCYNVKELMRIHDMVSVPIVFDSHHYNFGNDDLSFEDSYMATLGTWGAIKPLQHLSNTEIGMETAPFNKKRAHSAFIHNIPSLQLQGMQEDTIDVDIEAKMKNIALLKIRKDFNILS